MKVKKKTLNQPFPVAIINCGDFWRFFLLLFSFFCQFFANSWQNIPFSKYFSKNGEKSIRLYIFQNYRVAKLRNFAEKNSLKSPCLHPLRQQRRKTIIIPLLARSLARSVQLFFDVVDVGNVLRFFSNFFCCCCCCKLNIWIYQCVNLA